MTNYERIKAMSVEGIGILLCGDCNHCVYQGKDCVYNPEMHCTDGLIRRWKNEKVY